MAAFMPPELLTAAQIREADRLATASGIPTATLMENAGAAVAAAVRRRFAPRPVLIVCGGGNNGGDGLVAARHLKEKGWPVTVALVTEPGALKGDAAAARDRWLASGGALHPFNAALATQTQLIVDAIFGVGLNRAPEGAAAQAIHAINAAGAPVVAVDLPSGVFSDTGEVAGAAVHAMLTVSLFRAKPGLFLLPGKAYAGRVEVAEIGIPARALAMIQPRCLLNTPAHWRLSLPVPQPESHKYTRGHAVVIGGPLAMTGAAKLAAQGALRAGAGLVSIACDAPSLPAYAATLSAVMTKPVEDAQAFARLIDDKRVTGLLAGPGNGVSERTRTLLSAALASAKPCVVDADALTLLSEHRELVSALHRRCVLTPHEGEFTRLFGTTDNKIGGGKRERALSAAHDTGCVIVLKGNDTMIASPDGRTVVNANAPAWLATAGAGDVLSGIIAGLLAQGMDPFAAACAGVWMHGEAAALAGPGLIAEDLPALLPRVWRGLVSV